MSYVFTCKTHPDTHSPLTHRREKTSEGTSNLRLAAEKCDNKHRAHLTTTNNSSPSNVGAIPYSRAAHRAIILLRCAKNHRPFNSVLDPDYQTEVQMLRPGTEIPHPITISRDIRTVYLEVLKTVRAYFAVSPCSCLLYYILMV